MKLTSDGGVLDISGSRFSYRTSSSSAGSGTSISVYNDFVYVGGGEGAHLVMGSDHFRLHCASGDVWINSSKCEISNASTKIILHAGAGLTIDDKTAVEDLDVDIWKMLTGKQKLKFHKGILVNTTEESGSDTGEAETSDSLKVKGTLVVEKTTTLNDKLTISKNGASITGDVSISGTLMAYQPGTTTLTKLGKLAFCDDFTKKIKVTLTGKTSIPSDSTTVYVYINSSGGLSKTSYYSNIPSGATYTTVSVSAGGGSKSVTLSHTFDVTLGPGSGDIELSN